ncbi:hypothetical protein B5S29_g3600 [[Candida] boidinii]|nr:hypothetical protein B5S29_g3600 [[Candida] boidinii]
MGLLSVLAYGTILFIGISSYKYLPFVYFLRFYRLPLKYLYFEKPKNKIINKEFLKKFSENFSEFEVFKKSKRFTYCSILECDMYFHKTNSSYFIEMDLARSELFSRNFKQFFWYYQDLKSKNNSDNDKKDDDSNNNNKKKKFSTKNGGLLNWPYVALGTVSTSFLKEIKPFEKYYTESRVLTWDSKWFYILTYFKLTKSDRIVAIGIAKLVFKDDRKTIPPKEILEICNLFNDKVEKIRLNNLKFVNNYTDQSELIEIDFGI